MMNRAKEALCVSLICNVILGVLIIVAGIASSSETDLDGLVNQSRTAVKIAKEWRGVAKDWEGISNRFEKTANELLVLAQDWKKKAEDARESLDVCNSMLPREKRL